MLPKEIICCDENMLATAQACSDLLNIPIHHTRTEDQFLDFSNGVISLSSTDNKQLLTFTHSFDSSSLRRRIQAQDQHLLKAFKDKQKPIVSILDLTAGWCRDSFILANNNWQVTAVEQSTLIHFLTQFSLQRYSLNSHVPLSLIRQNSFAYLTTLKTSPDAIYIDPMFPSGNHPAKNKKEIQLLQAVTENIQINELFELALDTAKQRVVVKRPLHSEFLNARKPSFQYTGKTIRFDVYQCVADEF